MQLPVHLEDEQFILFDENDPDAVQRPQETQLTAFFKANEHYPKARSIVYPDFPTKFTWHRD